MNRDELLRQVQAYFETKGKYKPDKVGYWIWKGLDSREIPEIHRGKFSDAVAQAVQEKGIVRKVHVQELQNYNIPKVLLRDYPPIVESD